MQTLHQLANQAVPATIRTLSVSEKWEAVLARDSRLDGAFVFAVRSTRIYCRPSCPSRRTSREKVEFFPGPNEAEQAGFRACRRCHPRDTSPLKSELLARVCDYIQENLNDKITLNGISSHIGLSPFHLQRVFKQALGVSPRQYVERLRLDKLKRSLRKGDTVNNALYSAGFSSRSRLYETANGQLGVSPGTLRRGGGGMKIQYTIMDSPLGRLLLGATDRGICAVCMGASDDEAEARFSEEYSEASLQRNDDGMQAWVSLFNNYFQGENFPKEIPIDVQATAFQWKVWRQIQSIPYGQTTSYKSISEKMGKPESVRAVAKACADNRVALVIPCHRVVGKDGSLHGYRWGLERKRTLLKHERPLIAGSKNQRRLG